MALRVLHQKIGVSLLALSAVVAAPVFAQEAAGGVAAGGVAAPEGSAGNVTPGDAGIGSVVPLDGPLPVQPGEVQSGPIAPEPLPEAGTTEGQPVPPSDEEAADRLLEQPPAISSGFNTGSTGIYEDQRQLYGDDADDPFGFGVAALLGLHGGVSLVTAHSSNVRRSRDTAGGGGDWKFRPQLKLAGGHRVGRQLLFFNTSVGRDYYARHTNLNRSRFNVNGGLQWLLGTRCAGRFQGGYSTRSAGFSDFDEVEPSVARRTTFMAAASCQMPTGIGASLSYGYMKSTNTPRSTRSFADARSHSVEAGLSYALGQRGMVGVRLGFVDVTNPNQNFGPFGQGGTKVKSATGYAQYKLGPSFSIDGGLGYTQAKPKIAFAQGFSGMTWDAGVQYAGTRMRIRASTGRNISSMRNGQSNLRVSRNYTLTANYTAGKRLGFNAGYSHTENSNRGTSMLAEPGSLAGYKMDRWSAGANFKFNRLIDTGLDLRHRKRSTDQSPFGYSDTEVALTIRAGF